MKRNRIIITLKRLENVSKVLNILIICCILAIIGLAEWGNPPNSISFIAAPFFDLFDSFRSSGGNDFTNVFNL